MLNLNEQGALLENLVLNLKNWWWYLCHAEEYSGSFGNGDGVCGGGWCVAGDGEWIMWPVDGITYG